MDMMLQQNRVLVHILFIWCIAVAAMPEPKDEDYYYTSTETLIAISKSSPGLEEKDNYTMPVLINHVDDKMVLQLQLDRLRSVEMEITNDTNVFLGQLETYMNELPKNGEEISRQECTCDGELMSPCPDRCKNSCYYKNNYYRSGYYGRNQEHEWLYLLDCSELLDDVQCHCDSRHITSCASGELNKCYPKELTNQLKSPTNCSKFAIISPNIKRVFQLSSFNTVEPIRMLFRNITSQLFWLKQQGISINNLYLNPLASCEEHDSVCSTEVKQLLDNSITTYRELKKNIAIQLFKSYITINDVYRNVNVLKETTVENLNKLIRQYACCIDGREDDCKI